MTAALIDAAAMNDNQPDADDERGAVVMTASIAAFDGQVGQISYSAPVYPFPSGSDGPPSTRSQPCRSLRTPCQRRDDSAGRALRMPPK